MIARLHTRTAAAVLLGLGVIAGSASSPARAAIDPCALVTPAESAKALGASTLAPIHEHDSDGASCRIYSSDKSKNIVIGPASVDDLNGFMASMKAASASDRAKIPKLPPGIGDRALALGPIIYVQRGRNVVTVQTYLSEASLQKLDPQAIVLAKAVGGRL